MCLVKKRQKKRGNYSKSRQYKETRKRKGEPLGKKGE